MPTLSLQIGSEITLKEGAQVTILQILQRDINYQYDYLVKCKCGVEHYIQKEDIKEEDKRKEG